MTTPTHRSGHSLDLIITRDLDALVQTPPISDSFLSDHCTVLSERTLRMPATTVKEVCYRKTKAIDIEAFKDDLRKSRLCQDPPVVLTDLVSCYGSTMTSLLDKHAPLQKKTITVRPRVPKELIQTTTLLILALSLAFLKIRKEMRRRFATGFSLPTSSTVEYSSGHLLLLSYSTICF